MTVTTKQRRALEFITVSVVSGRSPSFGEIGAAVGLASATHAMRVARRLVRDGYLTYTSNGAPRRGTFGVLRAAAPLPISPVCAPGVSAIPLTQGKFALVDEADYESLARYSWHPSGSVTRYPYAVRTPRASEGEVGHGNIRMHRQIMEAPDGLDVDHANHDTLDNRRANLRVCTRAQNSINSVLRSPSGYRGVYAKSGKWCASITGARQIHLGTFGSPVDAARAYDDAARRYHGEFAVLNFPDGAR